MHPFKLDNKTRNELGDPPHPDDAVGNLRHVLAAFADTTDSHVVLTATKGAYIDRNWTGLTFGDLRAILELLDAEGIE